MTDSVATIQIRYDGIDAEGHQIQLHLLGESMQGIARILAVSGHFAATGQYAKQLQALPEFPKNYPIAVRQNQGQCLRPEECTPIAWVLECNATLTSQAAYMNSLTRPSAPLEKVATPAGEGLPVFGPSA